MRSALDGIYVPVQLVHSEVQKLFSIAFFENDFDFSVRITAARQLLLGLCQDDNILDTADPSWSINTCTVLLVEIQKIESLVLRNSEAGENLVLQLAAVSILQLFIQQVKVVRDSLSFCDYSVYSASRRFISGHCTYLDMRPVLYIVVNAQLFGSFSQHSLVSKIRFLCAQILCHWSHHHEYWIPNFFCLPSNKNGVEESTSFYYAADRNDSQKVSFSSSNLSPGRNIYGESIKWCLIPRHLRSCFQCVEYKDQSTDTGIDIDRDDIFAISVRKFLSVSATMNRRVTVFNSGAEADSWATGTGIPKDIFCSILSEHFDDSIGLEEASLLNRGVTNIADMIASAGSHTDLRNILGCGSCFRLTFYKSDGHFLDSSISDSLNKFLIIVPQNIKDMVTLSQILKFFRGMLSNALFISRASSFSPTQEVAVVGVFKMIINAICGPLSPILCRTSSHSMGNFRNRSIDIDDSVDSVVNLMVDSYSEERAKSASKVLQFAQYSVQLTLLEIMHELLSSTFSVGILIESLLSQAWIISNMCTLSCDESSPTSLRSASASCLERLVPNGSMWNIFSGSGAEMRSGTGLSKDDNYINQLKVSPADQVFRCCMMLRTPDSFYNTAALRGNLRLLLTCLRAEATRCSELGIDVGSMESQKDGPNIWWVGKNWTWLLRLIHDRRGDFRLLALEILDIVIRQAVIHGEDEGSRIPNTLSPYEALHHILMDSSECAVVKQVAGRILLSSDSIISSLMCSGWDNDEDFGPRLSQILSGLTDSFPLNRISSNAFALSGAVAALNSFMTQIWYLSTSLEDSKQTCLLSFIVQLLRNLKIVPFIVNLLSPTVHNQLMACASTRIFKEIADKDDNQSFSQRKLNQVDHLADLIQNENWGLSNGWGVLWDEVFRNQHLSILNLQRSAARFLQLLSSIAPTLFMESLKHTNLIRNLISCLAKSYAFHEKKIGLDVTLGSKHMALNATLTAINDLFSTIMARDFQMKSSSSNGHSPKTGLLFGALVKGDSIIPLSIVTSIISRIDTVTLNLFSSISHGELTLFSVPLSTNALLTSTLRIISMIIGDSCWTGGLQIPVSADNCSDKTVVDKLASSLFQLRHLFRGDRSLLAPDDIVLLSRVDFTISIILQHCSSAKNSLVDMFQALTFHSQAQKIGNIIEPDINLFSENIEFVKQILGKKSVNGSSLSPTRHFLDYVSASFATVPTADDRKAVMDPQNCDFKQDLALLKGKRDRNNLSQKNLMSSPEKVLKPTRGFMSPSGKSSSSAEQLRSKARGYTWNHEKEKEIPKNCPIVGQRKSQISSSSSTSMSAARRVSTSSGSDHEISAVDRLSLWSALLFLQSSIRECPSAQQLAVQAEYHSILSSMVRIAGAWSCSSSGDNFRNISMTHISMTDSVDLTAATRYTCRRSPDLISINTPSGLKWAPTKQQLAAAVFTAISAFTYGSSQCKKLFAQGIDSKASVFGEIANSGTLLHQLASLGLSTLIPLSYRHICLGLLSDILRGRDKTGRDNSFETASAPWMGIGAQKVALARTLNLELQARLRHGSIHHDPDQVVFLVDVLAACICEQQVSTDKECAIGIGQESKKGESYRGAPRGYPKSDNYGLEPMPIPDLVLWLWETYSRHEAVASAVVRLLGTIGETGSLNGQRKLLVNATTESSIQVLLDAVTKIDALSGNEQQRIVTGSLVVAKTAAVALWAILHNSERARAVLKALLVNDKQHGLRPDVFNVNREMKYINPDVNVEDRACRALAIYLQ